MKIFFFFLFILPSLAFSHGGDDGPSSLVEEFAKTSHIHLPVSYSTTEGLSFGLGGSHGEEHHEDDLHADETGLEITVHPIALGGVDKIRRMISEEVSESKNLKIEASTAHSPYSLVENKKWDLGLGIEGETHLPLPVFAAGVGVSYLKGKNYYSIRKLNSF